MPGRTRRSASTSSTDPERPLLEIGRVAKPHGVRGAVVVSLVTDRIERLDAGTALDSDRGPLVVSSSRPNGERWIVDFEGVDTRDAAEALRGAVLRAAALDDPGAFWVHELIGCDVADSGGTSLGRVRAVEANPASDLLVLEDDGLIPLRFVVERAPGRLVVDIPDGLLG